MTGKSPLYTIAQIVTLAILLVCNGFILDFILKLENGFTIDKVCKLPKECQTKYESSIFGFDPSQFHLDISKIDNGQSLSEILKLYSVPSDRSEKILKEISTVIDLSNIRAGNKYGFVSTNLCQFPDYFIYEINASKYITCELRGDHCAEIKTRASEIRREHAYGIIESSLWNALESQNLSLDLIDQMEDALSSAVDFHHVQKGNTFKLLFDRVYIEGKPSASGELIAAYFDTGIKEHYSISYVPTNKKGFYDINGSPMVSRFLQAPVRFSRISSGFNLKRFHPVLKYHRPHLGTDYAAPYGTPIMAVGNGIVESASYTGGNGNFVKIRHDKTFATQYLHMSKFARGIKKGAAVSQGQTIGYVGSTGLASGPHVCFRFWKNGVQVNHRNLRFPSPDPLPSNQIDKYFKHRDEVVKIFDSIQFNTALNSNRNS
ncbi:MAG: peptidoglycan DD-metalloendopeptidase family protein [Saprospiraceae bacterium]|nr:peptidoglycan DD-metalloendopeptidase family protein [Saprospiraceae bacterium]